MGEAVSILREKLLQYIEHAEDKRVKAFYAIIEPEIEDANNYSSAFKAELDKRYNDYKSGKTKMITPSESKKRIQKLLKSKSGK